MTLQEALESFIKYRESYCSQATINDYVSNLNIFIRYINDPDLQIDSVSAAQIVAYQTYLRDYVNPYNGKKLAVRSIRTYMTDVRTFFNYLYDFELIEKNPVKKVKIIKDTQRQLAPLTVDEVSAVDRCFELNTLNGLRNYLMFHLFLIAACAVRKYLICAFVMCISVKDTFLSRAKDEKNALLHFLFLLKTDLRYILQCSVNLYRLRSIVLNLLMDVSLPITLLKMYMQGFSAGRISNGCILIFADIHLRRAIFFMAVM